MLTFPGLCGLGLVAALCLSWSPMPTEVAAQGRRPAPPEGIETPDDAPKSDKSKRDAKDPKDLQREVDRLQREIDKAMRALKGLEDRGPAPADKPVPMEKRATDTLPPPVRSRDPEKADPKERANERAKEGRANDLTGRPQRAIDVEIELGGGKAKGDLERRVTDIERKLDTILWQLTELRQALAGGGPGGRGPQGPPPGSPWIPGVSPFRAPGGGQPGSDPSREFGPGDGRRSIRETLPQFQRKLQEKRQTLGADHPEIQNLQRQIQTMEQQLRDLAPPATEGKRPPGDAK